MQDSEAALEEEFPGFSWVLSSGHHIPMVTVPESEAVGFPNGCPITAEGERICEFLGDRGLEISADVHNHIASPERCSAAD